MNLSSTSSISESRGSAVILYSRHTRSGQAPIYHRVIRELVVYGVIHERFFAFGVHHARGREFCIGRGWHRLISNKLLSLLVYSNLFMQSVFSICILWIVRENHTQKRTVANIS